MSLSGGIGRLPRRRDRICGCRPHPFDHEESCNGVVTAVTDMSVPSASTFRTALLLLGVATGAFWLVLSPPAAAQQAVERAIAFCRADLPGQPTDQDRCIDAQIASIRALGTLMDTHPEGTPSGAMVKDCYHAHHHDFVAALRCASEHLGLTPMRPFARRMQQVAPPAAANVGTGFSAEAHAAPRLGASLDWPRATASELADPLDDLPLSPLYGPPAPPAE